VHQRHGNHDDFCPLRHSHDCQSLALIDSFLLIEHTGRSSAWRRWTAQRNRRPSALGTTMLSWQRRVGLPACLPLPKPRLARACARCRCHQCARMHGRPCRLRSSAAAGLIQCHAHRERQARPEGLRQHATARRRAHAVHHVCL
jgi:hypothetical protein